MGEKRIQHDPEKKSCCFALISIKNKRLTNRKAAKEYGRSPVVGNNKTLLNSAEKNQLSVWLVQMADRGFGLSLEQVKGAAKNIFEAKSFN